MVELRRSNRLAASKKLDEEEKPSVEPPAKKLKISKKNKSEDKIEDKTEDEAQDKPADKSEDEPTEEPNPASSELEVGDDIPDLILKNQDDKDVSLKELAKKNRIIVFFAYPKASTPGCTRQVCGYRDNYEDLKEHAAVFGLSADTTKAQKNFQTKQSLPYDLLSDPKREFIGLLGAKKTPQSGVIRSHWVFSEGKLRFKRVKISPETSVADGKKEVLELAKDLEKDFKEEK